MVREFLYRAPRTRSDLLRLLAEYADAAKILAGGTDLLPNIRMGLAAPSYVIDCKKLPDSDLLVYSPTEGLRIGHSVTINDLLRDRTVRERFPILAEAAHQLASHQVRNRATVVGNIVNASPCSDMAPPLLCLDALVVLVSQKGERVVDLRGFFTGPKATILRPGEFLSEIRVPAGRTEVRGRYMKLKRIKGHDLGIVGVLLARTDMDIRVAVSSAAPTPVLIRGLDPSLGDEAIINRVQSAIKPIDDVRCTAEYRRFMVGVYLRRLLQEVP